MKIGRLDDVKGTLRLILILAYNQVPLTQLECMAEADKYGVGRIAFYLGGRSLMEIGLVEETSETRKGKRVKYSGLTKDGMAITGALIKVDEMLGGAEQSRARRDDGS